MKLNKLSMIVVLAVGSLLACTTLATAQETNTPPPKGKRGMPTVEQQTDMMKQRLNLTDEQVPKVKAALEDRNKQMAEIRQMPQGDERREKMAALREEQSKKMKEILTPEQYTKYQSMLQGKKGGGGGEKKGE